MVGLEIVQTGELDMGWIVWMPVSLRFKIFKSVHFYVFVFELKRTVRFIERTNVFFFFFSDQRLNF